MKYLLSIFMVLMCATANAGQWRNGSGENTILGTSNVSDIDYNSLNKIVDPLDRMLAGYREGALIGYNDSASFTVSAGEVMLSNASGSIRLMVRNTASLTSNWSVADNGLDAGTEASATTYYVFAVVDNASDTTFKIRLSTSSTAPTGFTYYKKLGSFYNDASSNISRIINDNVKQFREKEAKTAGATYQALTDGLVGIMAYCADGDKGIITLYSDSASSPITAVGYANCSDRTVGNINGQNSSYTPVKAGDYYSTTTQNILANPTYTVYFVPQN